MGPRAFGPPKSAGGGFSCCFAPPSGDNGTRNGYHSSPAFTPSTGEGGGSVAGQEGRQHIERSTLPSRQRRPVLWPPGPPCAGRGPLPALGAEMTCPPAR